MIRPRAQSNLILVSVTVTGFSGGSGQTHSLVFKKLQSSVRPEVLEGLMDRSEGVSESSWIIKCDQVSRAHVYVQMLRHIGGEGPWFLLHGGKKTNTYNPNKVLERCRRITLLRPWCVLGCVFPHVQRCVSGYHIAEMYVSIMYTPVLYFVDHIISVILQETQIWSWTVRKVECSKINKW